MPGIDDHFNKPSTVPYNREKVVDYMQKWSKEGEMRVNPKYERFDDGFFGEGGDCANFVSQTLHESGIPMNDDWYYEKTEYLWGLFEDSDYSHAWTVANENYKYFSNPQNGFMEEEIEISSLDQIDETYQSGKVKKGDLLYWDFDGDGKIDHATMITGVDGELKYSGHTDDRFNASLAQVYLQIINEYGIEPKLHIVRMKDQIPSK